MLLQEQASRLQQVIAEAQSSAPGRAEGTDSCGAVHVRLGPDGLPRSLRVTSDWKRRVSADAFADAVGEACMAAARERMDAWAANLEQGGWKSRVDQLRDQLDQTAADQTTADQTTGDQTAGDQTAGDRTAADQAAADRTARDQAQPDTAGTPVSGQIPAAFAGKPRKNGPRPLHVLAENALSAFDAAERRAASAPGPPQGCGHAADGKLTLTLSAASLVSCQADPEWVSGQTATGLTRALGEALTAARTSLAGAAAAADADAARQSAVLGQIFAEAMELISSESRPPSRNGARHARVR
jgi:hypothetical protein